MNGSTKWALELGQTLAMAPPNRGAPPQPHKEDIGYFGVFVNINAPELKIQLVSVVDVMSCLFKTSGDDPFVC